MNDLEIEFMKYIESYRQYGEKIELKLEHTFRVQKLCKEIAENINLTKEEVETAQICGLLHDIGRFEQWKNYKSLEDYKTLDHGDLGYNILKKNNYINKYIKTEEEKAIVLKAVKYHNKYSIPKNLKKKEKTLINLTRDADKIDILYLLRVGILPIMIEDKPFSKEVYQALMNKKLISQEILKKDADATAVKLAFIFDINYSYSLKLMQEHLNYIIEKFKETATNKKLLQQIKEIQEVINNYIEERITC